MLTFLEVSAALFQREYVSMDGQMEASGKINWQTHQLALPKRNIPSKTVDKT